MTQQETERALNALESIATSLSLIVQAIASSDMGPVGNEDMAIRSGIGEIRTMDDGPLDSIDA